MTHELHTRFSAIRSGTSSKRSQDASGAVSRSVAGLRYGLRDSAAGLLAYSGKGIEDVIRSMPPAANRQAMRRQLRLAFHPKIKEAASRGGKTGARVMDTAHISFPASWPDKAQQKAMKRICELYAPAGSEAIAMAVQHTDKPGNKHCHIYAMNGFESHEAAAARAAANGTRPRRRLVNRISDLGSPKKMRAAIAAEMNAVADEMGLERVEHRTLKSRGIQREPKHMSQADYRAAKAAPEAAVEAPTPSMPTTPAPAPAEAPKAKKIFKGGRWITINQKPTESPRAAQIAKAAAKVSNTMPVLPDSPSQAPAPPDVTDKVAEAWKQHNKRPQRGRKRNGEERE